MHSPKHIMLPALILLALCFTNCESVLDDVALESIEGNSSDGDSDSDTDSDTDPDGDEQPICGDTTCSDTEYCAYDVGDDCGHGDATAVCKPRPEICTMDYSPVCGCDGKTYSNKCGAAAAGTGIMSEGECP